VEAIFGLRARLLPVMRNRPRPHAYRGRLDQRDELVGQGAAHVHPSKIGCDEGEGWALRTDRIHPIQMTLAVLKGGIRLQEVHVRAGPMTPTPNARRQRKKKRKRFRDDDFIFGHAQL